MSRITIRFDERSRHAWGTPVPVEVMNERLLRVAEEIMPLSDARTVSVPEPGLYHVRAELPTGERVATTVRVPTQDSDVDVTLTASEGSPHEYLAWAYARQSVGQVSAPLHTPQDVAQDPSLFKTASRSLHARPQVTVDGLYRIDGAQTPWRMHPIALDMGEDSSVAADDPRLIKMLHIQRSGASDRWFPIYVRWHAWGTPATDDQPGGFVAAPMGEAVSLLFVVAEAETHPGVPVHIMVSGTRPEAETLLAFLSQGAYSSARRIGEDVTRQAVELLQAKGADPFAACIAGYFLLRTSRLERQAWMHNLADLFPTIPDGAVIYGASLLQGNSTASARREARRYLLEAVRRGIPIYTVGLRLLFDSLRALAGEESRDNQLLAALAQARYIAAYTDWDAQTTTFSLPAETADLPFQFAD